VRLPVAVRRWGGYVLVVIVFAIACGLLSWWQWARNAEAQAEVDRVAANYDETPVAIDDLLPSHASWRLSDEWRPVQLTGRYLRSEQTLVRNRPLNGIPGFEVLVPLRLDDGSVVVVDRGWLGLGSKNDVPDHIPAAPSGEVTVVGRLQQGEPVLQGRTAPKGQIPSIDLPGMAKIIGEPTYTGAYVLMATEDPAPSETLLKEPKPDPDLGPHLSYALQWIAFGILAFVGLGWAVRHDRKVRREELEGAPAPPRRPKRRTDADIEDELLDAAGR
jgi:cytochrome oxidase assembly protein ShyY1